MAGLRRLAAEVDLAVRRRLALGLAGRPVGTALASGDGWSVQDVICTSGPDDRPFEERHDCVSIALVLAGTFQYRSAAGREMLTPGSLLLGNYGECYECDHRHAAGDRCVAFRFAPDWFEQVAADAGAGAAHTAFRASRVPPLPTIAPLGAGAALALLGRTVPAWEELALELAAGTISLAGGVAPRPSRVPRGALARVTDVVREIERDPAARLPLRTLAARAGLSPFHFLRTFERVTGVTPHQFILRARLRHAAARLATESSRVADVAFDSGFGDLSTFNRAFRAEFGASPRAFRNARRPTTTT